MDTSWNPIPVIRSCQFEERFHHHKNPASLRQIFSFILIVIFLAFMFLPEVAGGKETNSGTSGEDIAFVLQMSGTWLIDGHPPRKVELGQSLPEGGRILLNKSKNMRNSGEIYITIAFLDGKTPSRKYSDKDQPIVLPRSHLGGDPLHKRIIKVVSNIFKRKPENYVPVLSRGNETLDLQDSVVLWKDGKIDLSPVFAKSPQDEYHLLLEPLLLDKEDRRPPKFPLITFNWKPSAIEPLELPGAQPALYKLSLVAQKKKDYKDSEAWILICGADRYEKVLASYNDCLTLTKSWSNNIDIIAVKSFVRAYLYSLSYESI